MAKQSIGDLFVNLGVNSKAFVKGLKNASGRVASFGASVGKAIGKAGAFGLAGLTAAGTAATAMFASLTRRSFDSIDALSKTSDKLGITTQALAGLEHAAELSGVKTNQLRTGLQRMTRRLSDVAKTGGGPAAKAVAELGLNAEKLNKLSPDKQFEAIADAMEQVSNQADRVRLGFALFDSEGVGLINTMKGGAKALQAAQMEAEKLGLAFNRVEGKRIENANDAVAKLQAVLKGAGNILATRVAPFVEAIADALTDAGTSGRGLKGFLDTAFDKFLKAVGFVLDAVDYLKVGFKAIQFAGAKSFSVLIDVATAFVDKFLTIIGVAFPEFEERAKQTVRGVREAFAETADQFGQEFGQARANVGSRRRRFEQFVETAQRRSDARAALPFAQALAGASGGGTIGNLQAVQVQLLQQIADGTTRTATNTDGGIGAV